MNPQHNSIQNPAPTSAVQQVNPGISPQMFNPNAGGLFPNNMPVAAPFCFMNFPNQPFQLQNNITGFNPQHPFPVNQFNHSQQQQQGQFFAHNPMNPTAYPQNVGLQGQQVLLQNTIQNICQLLQLQNPNYTQCPPGNFPMFPNQIVNPQNPGFPVNQQFGLPNSNGPVQNGPPNMGQQLQGPPFMGQQLQGNLFLPGASGSVQTQQPQNHHPTSTNFQNQIPQIHNVSTNQMFAVAYLNETVQNVDQLPPGFEGNHKNAPSNVNGHKNFTGHKSYDATHKGFKSHKHVKEKLGINRGNMSKEVRNNSTADPVSQNSAKKVPSLTYSAQEINEWREARKKNYPTNGTVSKKRKKDHTLSDVTNQDAAVLRRQQLKEILAKQAELGCEVADIPAYYLSGPDKQNQHHKKGKFQNKRGKPSFQDRKAKRGRRRDQKPDYEMKREPSLLQKLLAQDIKRDKNRLLQVLRFITANSFLNGDSLRFPDVKVRETNVDEVVTTCSANKAEEEEEEGEIID